ncbi:hypothetical protein EPN95_02190 [Patescibacteria group bacterium]|nr:MAG: hypothetical protein EPN95_02190 [Patescibacteria group bacterium]
MPGRNILKQNVADSYYHIYARGVNKQGIYPEAADYSFFLSLIKRYLSRSETKSTRGADYPKLYDDIELLAYCLMPNHFHLLVYQINPGSMQNLMRRIMTSYSGYFNRKYRRSGPLFESRYRASMVTSDPYLLHISRYIHLNPLNWREYNYSSLRPYLGQTPPDWLSIYKISQLYNSRERYLEFLEDYQDTRDDLAIIKHELADSK